MAREATIEGYKRATGATTSERRLAELADRTFLDLWSWPNVYGRPGKEICDLLVVCGDDIIVFSDKDINWPAADLEVAWPRWYKRAIRDSVDQIRGAARWLANNPTEIYADAACKQRLPLELPPPERRRVHGICVAVGAENAASKYFNDPDGTFMIFSYLKGEDHIDFKVTGHRPFCIGDVDPDGPFVHVFNQQSLALVMRELDTIIDFTEYLSARSGLLRSNAFGFSPSEAELVANYLLTMKKGRHGFPLATDIKGAGDALVSYAQGEYAYFVKSPEYQRRSQANQASYAWDRLIRFFTEAVLGNKQYPILDTEPTFELAEQALRIMAQESRLERRGLGDALITAMSGLEEQKVKRFARVVMPDPRAGKRKCAYVFLVYGVPEGMGHEEYRRVRASTLETYVLSVLHDHRHLELCVGIAVSALSDKGSSEDLIALEQQEWSEQLVDELQKARDGFEVLMDKTKLLPRRSTSYEYPPDPELAGLSRQQRRAILRRRAKEQRRR